MSKYTTEVRFICEEYAGLSQSADYPKVNDIIAAAIPKIFDPFDIYDDTYRTVLETKIIKHYYTREIAYETVGRWKLALNTKLQELMPYYNRLYQSAMLEYNPLYDTDLTTQHDKQSTADRGITRTDKTTQDFESTSRNITDTQAHDTSSMSADTNQHTTDTTDQLTKNADTPQVDMTGPIFTNYLSSASQLTGTNTQSVDTTQESDTITDTSAESQSNTTQSADTTTNYTQSTGDNLQSTDHYITHIFGKSSGTSYASYIQQYREVLINIDMMIIDELADLFFNLW